MQVIPALPWSRPEDGGKIKLAQPVTEQNLLNGDVVVIINNGSTYLEAKFSGGGQLRLDYIPQEGGEAVKMYDAELSADGKTIVLTNPQAPAIYWNLVDVFLRDGLLLYPSSPLQHSNRGLIILPREMTMEEIQTSLYPILVDVGHGRAQNVGSLVIYPSDNKLWISSTADGQGEFTFKADNVNTALEEATYTSLNLIPNANNVSFDLVEVIETPSAPLMVPNAPWGASLESGEVILPEPMTFNDIVDGALVFATDYDKGGSHYDHFSIINQGISITLQLGVDRAFDINSWEGTKSVIELQRASNYEPAPLTAVNYYKFNVTPSLPLSIENRFNVTTNFEVNPNVLVEHVRLKVGGVIYQGQLNETQVVWSLGGGTMYASIADISENSFVLNGVAQHSLQLQEIFYQ